MVFLQTVRDNSPKIHVLVLPDFGWILYKGCVLATQLAWVAWVARAQSAASHHCGPGLIIGWFDSCE